VQATRGLSAVVQTPGDTSCDPVTGAVQIETMSCTSRVPEYMLVFSWREISRIGRRVCLFGWTLARSDAKGRSTVHTAAARQLGQPVSVLTYHVV